MERAPGTWSIFKVVRRNKAYALSQGAPTEDGDLNAQNVAAGDVFLGIDLCLDQIRTSTKQLQMLRRQGVKFWFFVYDLLPIEHPEWFTSKLATRFDLWLEATVSLADGYISISSHTTDKLQKILEHRFGIESSIPVHTIPLGCDGPSNSTNNHNVTERRLPPNSEFILTVGTIEPRKGYHQMVTAFEKFWGNGRDIKLVVVGRRGWKSAAMQKILTRHAQAGRMLFWFDDISDQELDALYADCSGLLNCSFDEGFGLPLLEAARHHKPVLARDIPPFRQQSRPGLSFFPDTDDAATLADHIDRWCASWTATSTSSASPEPMPTWADSWTVLSAILSAEDQSHDDGT
jgi:glycosyltransferase involved in cell wall biosynthesis